MPLNNRFWMQHYHNNRYHRFRSIGRINGRETWRSSCGLWDVIEIGKKVDAPPPESTCSICWPMYEREPDDADRD